MFDIARDSKVWERVRNDEAFARHRKEIKEQYDKVFEIAPRAASAWEVLEFGEKHHRGPDTYRQLQTSALLALIYPDNEEYYRSLVDVIWGILNEYTWHRLAITTAITTERPRILIPDL